MNEEVRPLGLFPVSGKALNVYVQVTTVLSLILVAELVAKIAFGVSLIDKGIALFKPEEVADATV